MAAKSKGASSATTTETTAAKAATAAKRANAAKWSPLPRLQEVMHSESGLGPLAGLPERHVDNLRRSAEKYLTALVNDAPDVSRTPLLDELEQRLGDFGMAHGDAARWMITVVSEACRIERESVRSKADAILRWDTFERISERLRGDAGSGTATSAGSDDFAQDVGESVQAITSVLFALSDGTDPQQALANVVTAVCSAFRWQYGACWEVDEEHLVCTRQLGEIASELEVGAHGLHPRRQEGPLGLAWEVGDVVSQSVSDLASGARTTLMHNLGVGRVVCVPIRGGEEVTAVVEFLLGDTAPLSQPREDMLRNISVLASASIDRMVRVQQMEAMAADAEAVSQVLHRLNSATSTSDAVAGALNTLCEAFGFAHGVLLKASPDGALHSTSEWGEAYRGFAREAGSLLCTTEMGLSGLACSRRELVSLPDIGESHDPRAQAARRHGLRGAIAMPLLSNGELFGTLELFSTDTLKVAEGTLRALRSASGAVSYTVERLVERDEFTRSLKEFSYELTGVSGSLRATTSEQSASAQELASAVGEVTATLSELRETSAEALRNAEAVIGQAEGASATSSSGRESVEHAIRSMRSIQEQVTEIAERILQLSDQTSQIGNIIATVNEISAQSKLLALNASIEAARAGEHGKGFGVVASEIRSLAEQSREATAQVRDILGEIQAGTNAAVVSAEEGTKKAESGMQLAEVSGDRIQDLAGSIEQSSASARLISNSSRQQNAGIEQVTQALVSISNATNSTASGLKQTEQAATRLVQLVERMSQLVRGLGSDANRNSTIPPESDRSEAAQ